MVCPVMKSLAAAERNITAPTRSSGTCTRSIARRPDVREKLRHAGFAANGRGPEAFAKRIAEDVPKWKDVIEKARISVK